MYSQTCFYECDIIASKKRRLQQSEVWEWRYTIRTFEVVAIIDNALEGESAGGYPHCNGLQYTTVIYNGYSQKLLKTRLARSTCRRLDDSRGATSAILPIATFASAHVSIRLRYRLAVDLLFRARNDVVRYRRWLATESDIVS